MFKNKLKSLAGGKKSKSKAAAGGAELANESETLAYSDVREKDLPKFLLACWQGDIGQVTKSLKKKLLVADTLYKGRSGLHLAAHMAHVDVLEHLIKMCPNMVNGEDPSGTTPLIRAVRSNSTPCVAALLECGCDVAVSDHTGATALHYCSQVNAEGMASSLIDHGAQLDVCDKDGNTPLHLAVLAGSLEMCDLLLARGSSPDILNEASMTPLMIAASENRVMITKNSLLKHPCNLLMQNRDGYTAADLALTHGNHGLNNLIVQSEPRQAPVASAALGGRQTSTSPHLASAPSPKSPDSAAGEPPSYHTLTSGGQAGRNPSVDDLDMSEAHDDTASQTSRELNSWGSEQEESDMEEVVHPKPNTATGASSRAQVPGGGGAGRMSPWTTLSPPAPQHDGSESSDAGSFASAIPARASRTRVPTSSRGSSRPQSPGAEQTSARNQGESRIPRPQAGTASQLTRKVSSASLQSGSRIPVPSQTSHGRQHQAQLPAAKPASPGGASDRDRPGIKGKLPLAEADGGRSVAINQNEDEDDDWDTESTISGDGGHETTTRMHASPVHSRRSRDSVDGPVKFVQAPPPEKNDLMATDSEESDFSIEEEHKEQLPSTQGIRESRPREHQLQKQAASTVAAADLGLDDISFDGAEGSRLESSFPYSDDEGQSVQASPTVSLNHGVSMEQRMAIGGTLANSNRQSSPASKVNVEEACKAMSEVQDNDSFAGSSDFSYEPSAELSPSKVNFSENASLDGSVAIENQSKSSVVPTPTEGSDWDSEDSNPTVDDNDQNIQPRQASLSTTFSKPPTQLAGMTDEAAASSAFAPSMSNPRGGMLTANKKLSLEASGGMFGELSSGESDEDEEVKPRFVDMPSVKVAPTTTIPTAGQPDDFRSAQPMTLNDNDQDDSSDFSLSEHDRDEAQLNTHSSFNGELVEGTHLGATAGSSFFGDVSLPTERQPLGDGSGETLDTADSTQSSIPDLKLTHTLPPVSIPSVNPSVAEGKDSMPGHGWDQGHAYGGDLLDSSGQRPHEHLHNQGMGNRDAQFDASPLESLHDASDHSNSTFSVHDDALPLNDLGESPGKRSPALSESLSSGDECSAGEELTQPNAQAQVRASPPVHQPLSPLARTKPTAFEEESRRSSEEALRRRLEQERLAKEAEERARLRQIELERLAKEEEENRRAEQQRRKQEETEARERHVRNELLEKERSEAEAAAAAEKKKQEAAQIKREREAKLAEAEQERQRQQQEVAARHKVKLQESIEEQRSLARRQSITMSPGSSGKSVGTSGTPKHHVLRSVGLDVADGEQKGLSQGEFVPKGSTESLQHKSVSEPASSYPASSLAHRIPRATLSPAGSVTASETDASIAATEDGGLSQDTLTGSEDLRALDSDSEFHMPLTTSTPVQRTTSHGRRRDMSSALGLGGDSTMTQHQQETIRELRGQLEDTKREMAAGRLRCNQLEKELAASKQSTDDLTRQKATAEHGKIDSEQKLRNMTFQHQQECEARQTAEALVVHVRERIEVLEKKMALETETKHSAESRCRQVEMEKSIIQSQLKEFERKLADSLQEVNQERSSKQLLNELLTQQKAYQASLQEEATKTSQSKSELAATAESASRECRELKDKLAVQQAQLELVQAELAVAQRHQDELSTTHEVDVEELRGMLQERHEALNLAEQVASQEKLSHQLELQNLENQLQLVTTKLESVQAQSKSYQDDLRTAEIQLTERASQFASTSREKELRDQSVKSLEQQLRSKTESHDRLSGELAAAKEKLSSLDVEVTLLRSQGQTANEKLSEREKAAGEAQQRFSEVLNSCRQDAERAKHDADTRQQNTYQQLMAAKEQLTRSESTAQSLQHELATLNKEYRLLSEKDTQLNTIVQEKSKQLADLEEKLVRSNEHVSSLSEKFTSVQHELASSAERERRLAEHVEATEKVNTEVSERLQLTTRDAIGVTSTKNDLEQELSRLHEKHAETMLELKELQKKYDDVTSDSLATKEAYVRLEARTSQLKSENMQFSQKLKEESSLRSVAEHDSEEAKTLWESEVRSRSHLGAQILGLEKKEASAKEALAQEKKKTMKALHMKRDAENRASMIDEKCTELEQLVNKYHADVKASKRRIKDLQSSQLAMPKFHADMDIERRRFQEHISSLEEKVGKLSQQVAAGEMQQQETKRQRSRLKDDLKLSRSELQTAKEREQLLHSAVESLEATKALAEKELVELKSQLGTTWISAAEMDGFRRKVELESRAELNRRLSEVNSHLQEQASTRTALEELQSAATSRNQSEQDARAKALKASLDETTSKLQDANLHHELALAEVHKYKKLYEAETRHSQSLSTRLLKTNRLDKQSTRFRLSQAQASLCEINPTRNLSDRSSLHLSSGPIDETRSKPRTGTSTLRATGSTAKRWS